MSSHAQKLLTLFRSYRRVDHEQANELLNALGPSQPELCAALFSDLSNPFETCLISRTHVPPQRILQIISWILEGEKPELDEQLFQIETIQLSDGVSIYDSLSRLPKTHFSLQYVSSEQAQRWLDSDPALSLHSVTIPFSSSHLNLLSKWSCKDVLIAHGNLGHINIKLNGKGSIVYRELPISKGRYSQTQVTYADIEKSLEQFLDGQMEKVERIWLGNSITGTFSLRRILEVYPHINEFQCTSLNPAADWSIQHPIRKIDWGWCKIGLSDDVTQPLAQRVQKVQCSIFQKFPWREFVNLEEVIVDCDEHYASDVLFSELDPKSELYVASTLKELCFNDVLSHLPFERTIVVGELESSPDFSKVNFSIVHPVRSLHWLESDFGRMLRQEIHFGGDVSLPLCERVTILRLDAHYVDDICLFPNLKTLHVFNCQEDWEDVQARFPNVSVTVSNRNTEVGLLNIRHEFSLHSDLRQRNALQSLARVDSCGHIWNDWLNNDEDGLISRFQSYSHKQKTFLSTEELIQCQWFIQHVQTHQFLPEDNRPVFFALILDAIYHQLQTEMDFIDWDWVAGIFTAMSEGYGVIDLSDPDVGVGTENICRLIKCRHDYPTYNRFLNILMQSVDTFDLHSWIGEVEGAAQILLVEWYLSEFKRVSERDGIDSDDSSGVNFGSEQKSQHFCMVVWKHLKYDFGLEPSEVFNYALKHPSDWEIVHDWLLVQSIAPVYSGRVNSDSMALLLWLFEQKQYPLQIHPKEVLWLLRYAVGHSEQQSSILKWWQHVNPIPPKLTPSNARAMLFPLVDALFKQGSYIPIAGKSFFFDQDHPWFEPAIRDLSGEYLRHNLTFQQFQIGRLDPYVLCSEQERLSERIVSLFEKDAFVDAPATWIGSWLKEGLEKERYSSYAQYWIQHHQCKKFKFDYKAREQWSFDELTDVLACLPDDTEHLELVNFPFDNMPNSIVRFTKLKRLMVYGTSIQSLPDAITKLVELESVSLSYTKFTALPNSLKSLPNLKKIYARGLALSDSDNSWLWELHIGRLSIVDMSDQTT